MSILYRALLLLCICSSATYATHLLGGEITASNVSGLTYKISVQLYLDVATYGQASSAQKSVLVCFGDGNTAEVQRETITNLTGDQEGIARATYSTQYSYPSTGSFQISTNVDNRSGSMLNLANAQFSSMFLWTVINTQVSNNTPVLPTPIYTAGAKQVLKIDLKATVSDSDSTTAHLQTLSKTSPGTCGVRSLDDTYLYPNDVAKKGSFKIDQVNKKLVWNAPDNLGKYIYAVVIDEWRDGIKISESYREGIITVIDKPGETVEIPPYESASSGSLVAGISDSENISISVEAYPIPTEDYLTVNVATRYASTVKVQLINLEGKIVQETKSTALATQWSTQLDLRQLTRGLYIVRALDDQGQFATKKVAR